MDDIFSNVGSTPNPAAPIPRAAEPEQPADTTEATAAAADAADARIQR